MELDNQQRRYGWLGGVVDGEGYICLIATQEVRRGTRKLVPRFGIVNTDQTLIHTVEEILKEMGIPFYRNDRPATKKWKLTMRITISGMKRCRVLLAKIRPYLVSKQYKADLALEYIESRMGKIRTAPYSDRELEIYKFLKVRPPQPKTPSDPLNDCTRDSDYAEYSGKIQSVLQGNLAESGRNDQALS